MNAVSSFCPCCTNPWNVDDDSMSLSDFNSMCEPCKSVKGVDPADLDTKVSPTDNFYRFANGGWIDNNPIPGEHSSWNTFRYLHELNLERLRTLLGELQSTDASALSGDEAKVAAFYDSFLDEEAVERRGLEGLSGAFSLIDSLDPAAPHGVLAKLHSEFGVGVWFGIGEGPDNKDSDWTIAQVEQSGLGLPDRDYYFDEDKASLRALYLAHVEVVLRLGGASSARAKTDAELVMALELELAATHMTQTELRDPEATYNKMSIGELSCRCSAEETTESLDWCAYFAVLGKPVAELGEVNVRNTAAIECAARMTRRVDSASHKAYLRFHLLRSLSPHIGRAFVDASFDFYSKALSGQAEQKPRWKLGMGYTEVALGDALGRLYVARHFDQSAKSRAVSMVERVRDALAERLGEVSWMVNSTKSAAAKKMGRFKAKIGFPDNWTDYRELVVVRGDHIGNVLRSRAWDEKRTLAWINAPTDRERWFMTPQTINAYFHPSLNEIVFPAAILQPPFFDPDADDATNFGAIGAVVGHEMTHGFDDQGRKYDCDGNMVDWWTAQDDEVYNARVAGMIAQAEEFEVHGVKLKGGLTCGENIADLGGLKLAYRALHKKMHEEGVDRDTLLNGFTPDQRFFLAWAKAWRQNIKKERALQLVTLDPHGPNELRVNGPLSNIAEFHAAFGVSEGDSMYRSESTRVDIW